MRWLTKKHVSVFFSLLVLGVVVIWNFNINNVCSVNGALSISCSEVFGVVLYTLIALALSFIPSLLTLPLAPSIFKAWKSFAVWAVPAMLAITALLILGGEGNAYFSFGFGPFILMILYGLYFLVSLVIIIIAAVKARKRQM